MFHSGPSEEQVYRKKKHLLQDGQHLKEKTVGCQSKAPTDARQRTYASPPLQREKVKGREFCHRPLGQRVLGLTLFKLSDHGRILKTFTRLGQRGAIRERQRHTWPLGA